MTSVAPPAAPPRTHAELRAALARRLGAFDAALRALVGPLSAAQRLWRPAPDRWGVADCCEHLLTVNALYLPRLGAALDAAPPPDPALDAAPWRPTWFGRWFVGAAGEGGRPIRAFAVFRPPPPAPDAPERLLAQQDALRALLDRAAGRDLRAPRVASPLSRLIVLRAGEALEMLVAHQERHLAQARRVAAAPDFPR